MLTTKSDLFIGEGQNVDVKILSGPVTEKNPSIENIIAVTIAGFVLGIILSSLWYVFKDERRKKDMFMRPMTKASEIPMVAPSPLNRMEIAGNFLTEDEYEESLKYIDKK